MSVITSRTYRFCAGTSQEAGWVWPAAGVVNAAAQRSRHRRLRIRLGRHMNDTITRGSDEKRHDEVRKKCAVISGTPGRRRVLSETSHAKTGTIRVAFLLRFH